MSGTTVAIITIAAVIGASLICFIAVYLFLIGGTRTASSSIEKGGARRLDAKLRAVFSDIAVSKGSPRALDAGFASNVRRFEPLVRYEVTGEEGHVEVTEGHASRLAGRLGKTSGRLLFAEDMPMKLTVDLGAGNGDFDLDGLAVEELRITASAGRVDIDAPGDMSLLEKVSISQKAGDVGLAMGGRYPAMKTLEVKNFAGKTDISLRGIWSGDVECAVTSGAGDIHLEFPTDVGVRVSTETKVGDVKAKDMTQTPDGTYTNGAYGKSEVNIMISVKNTAGQLVMVPAGPARS